MARLIAAVLVASIALTAFAAQAEDIRLLNNRKMLGAGLSSEQQRYCHRPLLLQQRMRTCMHDIMLQT